ncbi:hypothetical protein KHA80_19210 [Anaerobacillus sp. HL2]|nr:hypothetical protein KHA80_19210 [Anaerobacillus sp. HL2]
MEQEKVYGLLTKKESIVRINPEGRKISNELANEVRKLGIPGVYIAEDNKRHYPLWQLFITCTRFWNQSSRFNRH